LSVWRLSFQCHSFDITVDDFNEQAELFVGDVLALIADDVQAMPVAAGEDNRSDRLPLMEVYLRQR
jgi:hypothetical protein